MMGVSRQAGKARRGRGSAHDPEKWVPVFGKDHAPRKTTQPSGIVRHRIEEFIALPVPAT
jgi:hypothetical protein